MYFMLITLKYTLNPKINYGKEVDIIHFKNNFKIIKNSNLPDNKVAKILIDKRMPEKMKKSINDMGIETLEIDSHPYLYEAVSCHPDMVLHHVYDNIIVYEPMLNICIINALKDIGFEMVPGDSRLKPYYPHNIAYNVAAVGKFAFHNLKYTDPVLKQLLEKNNIKLIHVNQGYSKCSVCIVDENSIITSDKGIHKQAVKHGIDSLLIPPQKSIVLKGVDFGFIGGATGKLDKDKLGICGSLINLEAHEMIENFLKRRGIHIIELENGDVYDVGTIMPIMEYN